MIYVSEKFNSILENINSEDMTNQISELSKMEKILLTFFSVNSCRSDNYYLTLNFEPYEDILDLVSAMMEDKDTKDPDVLEIVNRVGGRHNIDSGHVKSLDGSDLRFPPDDVEATRRIRKNVINSIREQDVD